MENKPRDFEIAENEWEKTHLSEFKGEKKKEFLSESGFPLKRVYTPVDVVKRNFDYLRDCGFPGDYPYVRGIKATGYRQQSWTLQQYGGHGTPEFSNEIWKKEMDSGIGSLSIAYDLPTQFGLDPDDSMAQGEVGRVGSSISSLADFETAFQGIDISKIQVSQVLNAPAPIGVAWYVALAEQRGIPIGKLRGAVQNDVLKEYMSRGTYIFPPEKSMRFAIDLVDYAIRNLHSYMPIRVCGYHFSEKGATAIQEIAFMLANAFTYFEAAIDRGIDIDQVAPNIIFSISVNHTSLFEEVAKIRAARRIYARILKEKFHAKNPESPKMRVAGTGGGTKLFREQYLNNIARITLSVLAAALAGCQTINPRTYDEQFGIPSAEAMLQSTRCQQIVAYETGVTDVIDPLGGSYFLESLTFDIEERVLKELETLDRLGGVMKGIENGYFQKTLNESAYRWQKGFEQGEILRTGVNVFRREKEESQPMHLYHVGEETEQTRLNTLRELKQRRDNGEVQKTLRELRAMARAAPSRENNMMYPIIRAVKAYATIGEICNVLREEWGVYTESIAF